MKEDIVPNLFLVGAPKCGTTSIVNWLSSTKEVFIPLGREPHFFAEDIFPNRVCNSIERYQRLYKQRNKNFKYYLDGSTGYLSSSYAIPSIISYSPDSKFIAMVRDPAEMVISLHRERVSEGRETILSARDAWAQSCDLQNLREPSLNYKLQCNLAYQIKNLQSLVEPSNLMLLTLKEVANNPRKTFKEIMNFLDLSFSNYPVFDIYGAAVTRKSFAFQSLLFRIKEIRRRLNIPSIGIGFFKWLEERNTINKKSILYDSEFLSDLRNELRDNRYELLKILEARDTIILNDAI